MVQLYQLPVKRSSPQQKESFAYVTVSSRWPHILTGIIATLSASLDQLKLTDTAHASSKLAEGNQIVAKVQQLKDEMLNDAVLSPIEDDGEGNVSSYNEYLAMFDEKDKKWWTMDWLFAECYLYRRLRTFFAVTQHWKRFDPFFNQKADTYKSSSEAILELAKLINGLKGRTEELEQGFAQPGSAMELAFFEMAQSQLWGNATDLSLLVDIKYEDLQKLQAVGKQAQKEQEAKILRNDFPKIWEHLKEMNGGRVDIVLDNAGFELYTDLILADFLISCTPLVSEIVFHPKAIPWFVSDVLPYDFTWAISSLLDTSFFSSHAQQPLTAEDNEALSSLAKRWQGFLQSGQWKLSMPLDLPLGEGQADPVEGFWTTGWAYQDMPALAPRLVEELGKSDIVIFKGDLNYRKLVGDAWWPTTTDFEEALGPLKGKITIASLRTCKADVVVGLPEGVAEKLDTEAPDWRTSGKYAVVSFSRKS